MNMSLVSSAGSYFTLYLKNRWCLGYYKGKKISIFVFLKA